jgi:hypothetical protein
MTNNTITDPETAETTTALVTTAAAKPAKATSPQKVVANRRNAQRSTGPVTPAGKAVVAANAVKHGLLSWRPVLPHVEREDDWVAHLDRTLASLAPAGHLEAVLAERVALLLWRLDRVARYERETAAAEQSTGGGAGAEAAAAEAAQYRKAGERLDAVGDAADADPVDAEHAAWVVERAAERAGVELYEDEDTDPVPEPKWAAGDVALSDLPGWTAGRVREYLAAVAKHADQDPDKLWNELVDWVVERAESATKKAEAAERHRRAHLLPADRPLAKVQRYEAGLERSLYRALHELQRLQAARGGQAVPPPTAVDVTGLEEVVDAADGVE